VAVDEWARAIVSGILGGGLVGALGWYKFRDDLLTRRRGLSVDVFAAAEGFSPIMVLRSSLDTCAHYGVFSRARVALLVVETDPEIVSKLDALVAQGVPPGWREMTCPEVIADVGGIVGGVGVRIRDRRRLGLAAQDVPSCCDSTCAV
jgi:hypothetical protein